MKFFKICIKLIDGHPRAFLFLLSIIIFWPWVFSVKEIAYTDWVFWFPEALKNNISLPMAWSSSGFGLILETPTRYLAELIWGFIYFLPYGFTERILFFWPLIIFSLLAPFELLKHVLRKSIEDRLLNLYSILGSIVYTLNAYNLDYYAKLTLLSLAISFCPYVILLAIKLFEKYGGQKALFRNLVIFALVCFFMSNLEFRIFYLTSIILFVLLFFEVIFFDNIIGGVNKIFIFVIPVILFLLFNAYWLIGFVSSGFISHNALVGRSLWGAQYNNITNIFTLYSSFWSGGYPSSQFATYAIPFYEWLLPILAFSCFFFKKPEKKHLYVWAFIAFLGILLSSFTNPPLGNLYKWIYTNVPGFGLFRESSKFYFITALGYSVLIPTSIYYISQINKKYILSRLKYPLIIFVIAIGLINSKSIYLKTVGHLFGDFSLPNDYDIFAKYIFSQPNYFRTLGVPIYSRWTPRDANHGLISGLEEIAGEVIAPHGGNWVNMLGVKAITYAPRAEQIMEIFKRPFSQKLLSLSSIKYVYVPLQDVSNDDDFFSGYATRDKPRIRSWFINQLDMIPWLKRVNIGTSDLAVYENTDYKELVHAFSKLYNFDSISNFNEKYLFLQNQLQEEENYFIINDKTRNNINQTRIINPFELLNTSTIYLNPKVISSEINTDDSFINYSLFTKRIEKNIDSDQKTSYKFDDKVMSPSRDITDLERQSFERYQISNLPAGKHTIEFRDNLFLNLNLIKNPSFESGLWNNGLIDCNNYDDNPRIAMEISRLDSTDGAASLQLEASRHASCATSTVPIVDKFSYALSFDYKSRNSYDVKYSIGFDDPLHTFIDKNIHTDDSYWHKAMVQIEPPLGAKNATIYLKAESLDEFRKAVFNFDNVSFVRIPDLHDSGYLVADTGRALENPKSVDYEIVNSTKKVIHIKGASTPFFLAFSESYNDDWSLRFNNQKIQGPINSWIPFIRADEIPQSNHYKLDNYLNAWYLDTDAYCKDQLLCKINEDGSYDIEMVIEFLPQRWFYVGTIISFAALFGCVGYLITYAYKRRYKKKDN